MSTVATDAHPSGLEGHGITVEVDGQTILRSASIEVPVGKLIGLIGPSGSGKSTLLRALAGVVVPTEGEVLVGGEEVRLRSSEVGYVPFGTLLHKELTVREALRYAAELRLPPRTPAADLEARVDEVLAELQMEDRAHTRIADLSDGQRRRASCGAELVGRPPVLLLDEPATGLDAVLERRMMELLRRLADEGRGVLVATHATSSLGLCDIVAVMGPGGELRFVGPPHEMLERFGVAAYDEVYTALGLPDDDVGEMAAPERAPSPPRTRPQRQEVPSLSAQTKLLSSRYARCLVRDRRTLAILIGQAPVIGIAIGLAMPRNILDSPSLGDYYAVMLCFLLITGSIWLGIISACREIVRERAIVERETAVGVRLDAYLCAKCAVLFPLVALQVLLLVFCAITLQPLGGGPDGDLLALLVCIGVGWAAVATGLWLSAAVYTPDQATSSVPLALIPQLLLAGAVIPYGTMFEPMQALANLMIARWALAGVGAAIGLDTELSADIGAVTGFDPAFYSIAPIVALGALAASTLLLLSAAGLTLERRLLR